MLNYIIVQAAINYEEACSIKKEVEFENTSANGAYTNSFKHEGITKLAIWINLDKIFVQPEIRNCALKATINCNYSRFFENGIFSIEKVLDLLLLIQNSKGLSKEALSWNIQTISFTRKVSCLHPLLYKKLLLNNFCANNQFFEKIIEKHGECQSLSYLNKRGEKLLELFFYEKDNCIKLNLTVQRKKLENMKNSSNYPINSRLLCKNKDNLEELEKTLWYSYLNAAAGSADYYSYKYSEKIIDKLNVSHKAKQQMCSVLKGISLYKNVANYLDHVENQTVCYKNINTIKNRNCALKYIHMLSDEAGINPINISRRTALEIKTDTLKNLIGLMGIDAKEEKNKFKTNRKMAKTTNRSMSTITSEECSAFGNL